MKGQKMVVRELDLQQQVADYLRLQYPSVIFHSDYGSGVKLTIGQAAKQKRLNGGRRAWPDMFIAKPKKVTYAVLDIHEQEVITKCGLYLELKREGTRLKKKNGEWASEHIAEQAEMLGKLEEEGYHAVFAVGFDEAQKIIDEYLKGVVE